MPADHPPDLSPDLLEKYEKLQRKLLPLWEQIGRSDPGSRRLEEPNTVVVLPSLTVDTHIDFPSQRGYEERMLFMLFLLRQPHVRLIYLTSAPIDDDVIDYYLDVMPSVTRDNARRRLHLISPGDFSERPLVKKLLDRPKILEKIRSTIPDLDKAHLVPFVTTDYERELALRLNIPMYAADPRYFAFGTKSGCRRLFAEVGLNHPLGEENIYSADALVDALARMRQQKPGIGRVVAKLNQGVSGFGNAQLALSGLPAPGDTGEKAALRERINHLEFELAEVELDWYLGQLEKDGGIVEEMIVAKGIVSPSAQLRVTPLGEV